MTSTVSETTTQREMDSLRTGGEEMSRVHPLNRKQRLGGFESISTEVLPPLIPPHPPGSVHVKRPPSSIDRGGSEAVGNVCSIFDIMYLSCLCLRG